MGTESGATSGPRGGTASPPSPVNAKQQSPSEKAKQATDSSLPPRSAYPKGIVVHDVKGIELLESRPADLQPSQDGGPSQETHQRQPPPLQQQPGVASGHGMPVSIVDCETRPLFFTTELFHRASCWVTVMLFFASRGVRCFAMSYNNHDRRSVDDYVQDIDTCIRFVIFTQRMHEPVLIGHGLGAAVLLNYLYTAQNEISFPLAVVLSPIVPSLSWAFCKAAASVREVGGSFIVQRLWDVWKAATPFYSPGVYRALALACPKDEQMYSDDIVSQIWEHEVRGVSAPWRTVLDLLSRGLGYESGAFIVPELAALRPEHDVWCSPEDAAAFKDYHGRIVSVVIPNVAHDAMLSSSVAMLCEKLLNIVAPHVELREKMRRDMEQMLRENREARE